MFITAHHCLNEVVFSFVQLGSSLLARQHVSLGPPLPMLGAACGEAEDVLCGELGVTIKTVISWVENLGISWGYHGKKMMEIAFLYIIFISCVDSWVYVLLI